MSLPLGSAGAANVFVSARRFARASALARIRRAGLGAVLGSAGTVAVMGACDDPSSHHENRAPAAGAAPLASIARALDLDASELEPRVDPPAPSGDFESELDQFTTVDACARQHAGMDPLVGDALEAIGYDTFLRDACRVLDAAKAKDSRRCDAIDASSLRSRCRSTVAEILGTADACPWEILDRPTHGRDPLCVAIATHDARLCLGVRTAAAKAFCEAIAGHDDTACARVGSAPEQERCARDARRWRAAMGAPATSAPPPAAVVVAGELRVEVEEAGPPIEVSLAADLEHGVVVIEQRDGVRFALGPLSEGGLGFVAPSLHERAAIAVALFVRRSALGASGASVGAGTPSANANPSGATRLTNSVLVEQVEVLLPGRAPLATPSARSSLVAKLDDFEPARGATVRFSLDGAIENAAGRFNVHVRGVTFVRDVVKASAIYGLDARPLGGDEGMR